MNDKAAALQLLDEQLTAAGHDPECAAYEPGNACSGPPVCNGEPIDLRTTSFRSGAATPVASIVGLAAPVPPGSIETLTGPAAMKLREYKAAVSRLKTAEDAYKQAAMDMRTALEAFTAAVMP